MPSSSSSPTPAQASTSSASISKTSISKINVDRDKYDCRMYENKYPEVDDLVMVNVRQIAEMGAYVTLLEYNNIEGMVLLSELSRRRIRSIQKLIRVGRNEVVVVLRVDKEKGYIDLSKRRVSPEEVQKCEEKFLKSKAVHTIMRNISEKHSISTESLYEQLGWPLYKQFGHAYDAFKLAIEEPERVFGGPENPYGLDAKVLDDILVNINRRLLPQKAKIRADIEVMCYTFEGIEAIKEALRAGETLSTEQIPIKIKLVAPPLYVIFTNCFDKIQGLELLAASIAKISEKIVSFGGMLNVKMNPRVVSDVDDLELDAMMKRAEQENAEVSGDEDNSEEDDSERAS
ncbi:hypothetical protein MDAP_002215 [Mitosporidium daphniae]|uniref:S1 motif domain-containing protein n=1 Tax=Mitosporidium daphniae TaxID=1485682 RepID=A0A098VPS9_9MICR|nr:uncharacterized protein DI09_4p430 [Mitosporidium daphniae]KGG50960.1 hypothetical protein DI09_4p430 [Mitosporidium daphniae]|eukprot:XP_013237387.1 uncharacterized protein DI09_4p430 [Mitosporidium daphniae]